MCRLTSSYRYVALNPLFLLCVLNSLKENMILNIPSVHWYNIVYKMILRKCKTFLDVRTCVSFSYNEINFSPPNKLN
jgi:hypothetical protein